MSPTLISRNGFVCPLPMMIGVCSSQHMSGIWLPCQSKRLRSYCMCANRMRARLGNSHSSVVSFGLAPSSG